MIPNPRCCPTRAPAALHQHLQVCCFAAEPPAGAKHVDQSNTCRHAIKISWPGALQQHLQVRCFAAEPPAGAKPDQHSQTWMRSGGWVQACSILQESLLGITNYRASWYGGEGQMLACVLPRLAGNAGGPHMFLKLHHCVTSLGLGCHELASTPMNVTERAATSTLPLH